MNPKSEVSILLEKKEKQYLPGEAIHGKVVLNLQGTFDEGDFLNVKIIGTEYGLVKFTNSYSKGESGAVTTTAYSSKPFLDTQIMQLNAPFNSSVNEYPFTFLLPTDIFGSMATSIPGPQGGDCRIHYFVDAKMYRKGWKKAEVENSVTIKIDHLPLSNIDKLNAYYSPTAYSIFFWGCWKRGDIVLGLNFYTVAIPDEQLDVGYVIQNNSNVKVISVEFVLREITAWKTERLKRSKKTNLSVKTFRPEDLSLDVTSVKQRQTPLLSLENLKEILDAKKHSIKLKVPLTCKPTVKGKIISVSHLLEMRINTSGGNNNPVMYLPLMIFSVGSSFTSNSHPLSSSTLVTNPLTAEPV
jgi:hypothetical protein